MAFVQRNTNGKVVGVCPFKQDWAQEELADDHPDVLAYQAAGERREMRMLRDNLLLATDWLVTRHRDQGEAATPQSLSVANYAALLAYRQALRDWPDGSGFPQTAAPAKPAFMS